MRDPTASTRHPTQKTTELPGNLDGPTQCTRAPIPRMGGIPAGLRAPTCSIDALPRAIDALT